MNPNSLPPGLMLVHGNRSERLRDLLVEWMKRYPLAPLENETILVQSNGIAQWLKLALAAHADAQTGEGGCGIAAALDIVLPSRFIWKAYRAVLGADCVAEDSPFDKPRLAWRLMRVVPSLVGRAEFEPLRRFISRDDDRRKRYQLAERIADLFEQYQMYRADWLAAWAQGDDVAIDARGERHPLPDEQRWQAALWRELVNEVAHSARGVAGEISSTGGRAAVHEAFMRRASTWPEGTRPAGLPRRIVVFGISSLPRQSLEALAMLSRWSQVLMCVPNPCAHYWADIVPDKELLKAAHARQARREGAPAELDVNELHLHAHPLLASWGKQGRDFIGLLDEFDSAEARAGYLQQFTNIGKRIDLFEERHASTMLQQLQDDIRDLRLLHETRESWPPVDPVEDDSIRFHIAHGPQREVEILHDQLLAAFNADPTLRPRDIIVMVPEIEAYAPHIQAVFGLLDRSDPRYIPFSLADHGQRAANPLIGALETLLGLPQSRFTVSDLLDLLDVPALRARFGIAESDLPRVRAWVRGANVRWGLHAEQRASLGLPHDDEDAAPHTWAFGLRRMLLGYAVGSGGEAWNDIEPFGEVGGLDAALLGPLARLLDALDNAWRSLRKPATVAVWCDRLRTLRATFFSDTDAEDAYTFARLDGILQDWLDICTEAELADELPLSVVGDYWLAQLDQGALSQRFFTGAVTFATLMPMRAIPFRRVCLLGMNDGDYPRARVPMDFDLMRGYYRPGDRSRREDDRYLLLEAVLSARDHLHVSWVGRSINDNSERPPSVLIGQLRDHLAQGWASFDDDQDLLDAITVEHRLQPFSAEYFRTGDAPSPLFTYAAEWRSPPDSDARVAQDVALPALVREEPLSLRDLADFLKSPVRAFFRQRLRVSLDEEEATSVDEEPFELDALSLWSLQDELIRAQAAGALTDEALEETREAHVAAIRRRGDLATGGFGDHMSDKLLEPMQRIFDEWRKQLERWPNAIARDREIRFDIAGAFAPISLADWLGHWRCDDDGNEVRLLLSTSAVVNGSAYRYSRLVGPWVEHLAANGAIGGVTTVIVSKKGTATLAPLSRDIAQQHLATLMRCWETGMARPLPFAIETSLKWLIESRNDPAAAETKARAKYEGDSFSAGEVRQSASLHRVYPSFAALAASDEFAALATQLLDPMLDAVVKKDKREKKDQGADA
ncbi:Exodeoxyribonuclease V gamma chain [Candidatus Burkholderia verschuerenii]|uniref:RecBCD enzyme subunit RecC n=1 Tax=Candidatus Burkholderia verschuerenii TaxID=242163 RepID=A0A0L0MCQ8_9BURK|nr:exodeoxyribonuclease V subunit gamma [Candidatus Burkholderia verschuerenii]KND60502.1 Exodeoxyribonuclease V gamma chain [Candidatus Burkholderia verschuerenii]